MTTTATKPSSSSSSSSSNRNNANNNNNNKKFRCYPFSAVLGQEDLKTCLILCAIDPSIGGVLIRGDKGTAKSTAARGLANLLPPISVAYDPETKTYDPYNREKKSYCESTTATTADNDDCNRDDDGDNGVDMYTETRDVPTPFVDLPIGATEDRVLGCLDFAGTIREGGKKRVFSPGLLASANRGILYVDEVNLLPAHLVDVLLDAAASGVNTVQREGAIVRRHPAKFVLIGTMNPEEGDLRPQLLDRFGLAVDVAAPRDASLRAQVVRSRIAFERNPETFMERWRDEQVRLADQIRAAQELLSEVVFPDDLLLLTSTVCTELEVDSLRADITLYKAATALAAWEGRRKVLPDDVRRAAAWALAHRRRRRQPFDDSSPSQEDQQQQPDPNDVMERLMKPPPSSEDPGGTSEPDGAGNKASPPANPGNDPPSEGSELSSGLRQHGNNLNNDTDDNANGDDRDTMKTFTASKPDQIKRLRLAKQKIMGQPGTGRRNPLSDTTPQQQQRGHYVRSVPTDKPIDLALDATLRAAVADGGLQQSESGQQQQQQQQLVIEPNHWRRKVRQCTADTLVLFLVDASGSMAARQRMEAVKGAVLALLTDAYQQRETVGAIAFRGCKAEVLLSPTKSVESAEKQLRRLPTGGRTPLPHGLHLAYETIDRHRRQQTPEEERAVLLIVLSDGKANVPLPDHYDSSGGDSGGGAAVDISWKQTERIAAKLRALDVPTLMLDTEAGSHVVVRIGRGRELARLLNADYMRLDELTADGLIHTVRRQSKHS